MPVIQPDIQTLVANGTLDDDIRLSVIVDIGSGYGKSRFRRLKCELDIIAARQMKFDAIGALTVQTTGSCKDSPNQLVIVIEIRYGERLPEWYSQTRRRCGIYTRQRTFDAVLTPQARRRAGQKDYQDELQKE